MLQRKKIVVNILHILVLSLLFGDVLANEVVQHNQSMLNGIKYLSTYQQLEKKLAQFEKSSHGTIKTGPLIKNGNNQGLIDIDVPLDQSLVINSTVCGESNPEPSIRSAVICTVNDGGRGNIEPTNIG